MLKRTRILLDRLHVEVLVLEYVLVHVVIHAMAVLMSVPIRVLVVVHVRIHVTHRAIRDVPKIALVRVLEDAVPLVKDVRVNALENAKAVLTDVARLVRMDAIDNVVITASRTAILDAKARVTWAALENALMLVKDQQIQTHAAKIVALLIALSIVVRPVYRHVV